MWFRFRTRAGSFFVFLSAFWRRACPVLRFASRLWFWSRFVRFFSRVKLLYIIQAAFLIAIVFALISFERRNIWLIVFERLRDLMLKFLRNFLLFNIWFLLRWSLLLRASFWGFRVSLLRVALLWAGVISPFLIVSPVPWPGSGPASSSVITAFLSLTIAVVTILSAFISRFFPSDSLLVRIN